MSGKANDTGGEPDAGRRTRTETDVVVDELNLRLRLAERPCMTLRWPYFYELCGRERLEQPFLDDVRAGAASRFRLIVAYGRNAVIVCDDRNFAAVEAEGTGGEPSRRRQTDDVVDELNRRLVLAGRPCMTLDRSGFYGLCGRERLKQPFLDDIRDNASGRFQLIVAYGGYAVVVCHDRNFAEAGSGTGKHPRG